MDTSTRTTVRVTPWNKGKLLGQKPPLKLKEIWAIRIRLQLDHQTRELALFNLGVPAKELPVTIGVDLAISEKEGADYTAMCAVSRDPAGHVWIRDVRRARMSFNATLGAIKAFAEQWKPKILAIEATQYQVAAVQELVRTTTLPVRSVKPDKDKVTRFQALAARYEQRLVYHAPDLNPEFERELLAFPVGSHDDMVDAAVYAFAAGAYNIGPPPDYTRGGLPRIVPI